MVCDRSVAEKSVLENNCKQQMVCEFDFVENEKFSVYIQNNQ